MSDQRGSESLITVAHRGGNSRHALRAALSAGVEWIEVDIWLHHGRLLARHDRTLWRLPITYGKRSVALQLAPALVLEQVIAATEEAGTRLLVDLKGRAADLPRAIVERLHDRDAFGRAALCGQEWEFLDAARAQNSRVQVIFSLGRREHLELYLARRRDGTASSIACCYHGLLTPSTVAALKEAGSTIIAWTVDAEPRARELLGWGVDGLTSNDYPMLRLLRAEERPATGSKAAPIPRSDGSAVPVRNAEVPRRRRVRVRPWQGHEGRR